MIEKIRSMLVTIRTSEPGPNSKHPNWDKTWDVYRGDDHDWSLGYWDKNTWVSINPQDVVTLLRELADEIECEMEAQEDYQAEFEERAAILEHDGNMTSEQAETQAGAETLG